MPEPGDRPDDLRGEAIVLDPYSKKLLMEHYPFPCFHDNAVVTEDPIAYLEEHDLP